MGTSKNMSQKHVEILEIGKHIINISNKMYPLVNIQKAIENSPVEIVSFPIKNDDFP